MNYTLKRSRGARYMRLAVQADGAVVVTAPEFFGLAAIERFLASHSEWVRRAVEKTRGRVVVRMRRADIPALKKKARAFAQERCEFYARFYGVSFRAISIRAQKTRWGSCSRNGNLSFNYRIIVLPPLIAEYIIVHEICHLREMNHSKKFWDLVAQTIPEHRAIRKELRNTVFVYN